MKYRVYQGYYCPTRNVYVYPGEYDESEIDVVMARRYTQISPISIELTNIKEQPLQDQVKDLVFNTDLLAMSEITVQASSSEIKIEKLKINTAHKKLIEDIKYVSKKNAADVVEKRAVEPFKSYDDLNSRVPLSFKRKWEDLTVIDFELKASLTEEDLQDKYYA